MSSSGYLDEKMASSSALITHLQQQPYHRRISPHTSNSRGERRKAGQQLDDVDDDDELESDHLSVSSWDSEEEERRAQEEWEESLKQLNLALQVMVLPFFGKWLGRKWSYWAFSRYQLHGFSMSFFGISWLWAPTTIIPGAAVAALQP